MLFGSFLISKQSAPSIERLDEHGAAAPRLAALLVLPTCRRGVCALGHYYFPPKKPYFRYQLFGFSMPFFACSSPNELPQTILEEGKKYKATCDCVEIRHCAPQHRSVTDTVNCDSGDTGSIRMVTGKILR